MKFIEKKALMDEVWNLKRKNFNSLQVAEELGQPLRLINKLYPCTFVQLTPNRPRKDGRKLIRSV